MKKENILFGVAGLLAGLIVGFMFANSVNKSAVANPSTINASSTASANNPALPPDHPPLTQTGDEVQTEPLPQVMEAIEKAKQQPQNYEAQMTAGDLYYQTRRFQDATGFYETANQLRPDEIEPMIKLGNAWFDVDQFEQAEKWYQRALQKNANDINVRTDLGLTFFLRTPRDIDRAIKEYKTSLSIDPAHEITLQNLALAYDENGDKDNLQATLEKLKKVNPNNPVVLKKQ